MRFKLEVDIEFDAADIVQALHKVAKHFEVRADDFEADCAGDNTCLEFVGSINLKPLCD
jgi:hypothetical protein